MNRNLKGLLVAVLALSAGQVQAAAAAKPVKKDATNRTFLSMRAHGVNLPMESTGFNELAGRKAGDKFGANFAVTGFYSSTVDGKNNQSPYFLFQDAKEAKFGTDALTAFGTNVDGSMDYGQIVHVRNAAGNDATNLADATGFTLALDPRQTSYGVRLDYHQDLHKIVKGLYLRANLPVVRAENDLRAVVNGGTVATIGSAPGSPGAFTVSGAAATKTINDVIVAYFKGNLIGLKVLNQQAALKFGKIDGKRSETGVADIDVQLGYKFVDKAKYSAALGLGVTIPTGNKQTGEYAFAPVVGNGGHFGLGGDLCAGAQVWSEKESNVRLNLHLRYRYLFESSEKRILGLRGNDKVAIDLAQYKLLGDATTMLLPAANILTQDVNVTPGSQLDGVLGLAYNSGGFSVDLGYNMYFREEEGVKVKTELAAAKYGLPTGALLAADNAALAGAALNLSKDNVDTTAATTPSQFTNSVFGGANYIFRSWDCPLMLGLGGNYEFASKRSAFSQWGVWGKVGIGF